MGFIDEMKDAIERGDKVARISDEPKKPFACTGCSQMGRTAKTIRHCLDCKYAPKLTAKEKKALRKQMADSIKTRWTKNVVKAPSLLEMAKYIRDVLGLRIMLTQSSVSTDRKAGRLRIPGKGRIGNRLSACKGDPRDLNAQLILDHNSAETYRHNTDVCRWILEYKQRR